MKNSILITLAFEFRVCPHVLYGETANNIAERLIVRWCSGLHELVVNGNSTLERPVNRERITMSSLKFLFFGYR